MRRGATRLELGQTTYDLKRRRGAEMSPRWLYIKGSNPGLHLTFRAASRGMFQAISPPARRVFKDDGARRG
ncbi:MAG: hypothetical protein ACREAA_04135 [Candidatus Polarisedimenticolia bacterium]